MILQQRENRVCVTTPAKVNLFLELLAKRADGFHEIETVMVGVSIFDTLVFSPRSDDEVRLKVTWADPTIADGTVPSDGRNLVVRAVQELRSFVVNNCAQHTTGGVNIELIKRIPTEAGLGGASSDAAAALVGINRLWNAGLDIGQLSNLASKIGSDVPFFLTPATAICRGRGEVVEDIPNASRLYVVVGKPPVGMSTKEIYSRCKIPAIPKDSVSIRSAIDSGRVREIGKAVFNRLQSFAGETSPWVTKLKTEFSLTQALGHQLTGSGSCYFGLYSDRKAALKAARCLSNRNPDVRVFVGHTLGHYSALKATKTPCPG